MPQGGKVQRLFGWSSAQSKRSPSRNKRREEKERVFRSNPEPPDRPYSIRYVRSGSIPRV